MKNSKKQSILTIVVFFIISAMYTQNIFSEFDSIPINNLKSLREKYNIPNSNLGEITLVKKFPKTVEKFPLAFLGGSFTLLTGISTEIEEELNYVSRNEIKTENSSYTWEIPFYFVGESYKSRDRVKNDDGSFSIISEKTISINWDNGIFGYIIEKNDTLGNFSFNIYDKMQPNEFIDFWMSKIKAEENSVSIKIFNQIYEPYKRNYVAEVLFKEKKITFIGSHNQLRSIILIDDKPLALFQNISNDLLIGKKKRTNAYVLIDQNNHDIEQNDLFRLLMLNIQISKTVGISNYEY